MNARKSPNESERIPHRNENRKRKPPSEKSEKPLPPDGLWIGDYDDSPFVDGGVSVNE